MTQEPTELRVRAEVFQSLSAAYERRIRRVNSPVAQEAYERVLAAVMEAETALMSAADALDEQLPLPLVRAHIITYPNAEQGDDTLVRLVGTGYATRCASAIVHENIPDALWALEVLNRYGHLVPHPADRNVALEALAKVEG